MNRFSTTNGSRPCLRLVSFTSPRLRGNISGLYIIRDDTTFWKFSWRNSTISSCLIRVYVRLKKPQSVALMSASSLSSDSSHASCILPLTSVQSSNGIKWNGVTCASLSQHSLGVLETSSLPSWSECIGWLTIFKKPLTGPISLVSKRRRLFRRNG